MIDIRNQFPLLRQTIYLDTASCGLVPKQVRLWRSNHDENMADNISAFRAEAAVMLSDCRTALSSFLDAGEDEIALIPNFSIGLNMVLDALPKQQKVLLLKNDYPSVTWPVETRDFNVCYAEINENLEDNITAAIKKHHPDLLILSVVQWLSGIKVDLQYLRSLKQLYPDLLIIVDSTQYLGTEHFSFSESGIDILISSNYKWLTAGFGNGILAISKKARESIFPKSIGFMSAESFCSTPEETLFMKHFEPGHLDSLSFGSLHQVMKIYERDSEMIFNRITSLAAFAKEELQKLNLLSEEVLARANYSPIFNIAGDKLLFNHLQANDVGCALRGNGIRLSFHYYNNQQDVERLVSLLKARIG